MHIKTSILLLSIFVFVSCKRTDTNTMQKKDTPKALKSDPSYSDYLRGSGSGDLVETLYAEQVDRDTSLKSLEDLIHDLNSSQIDSTSTFSKYNQNNLNYYGSAQRHLNNITDSSLKTRLKEMIAHSQEKYKAAVTEQNELLQKVEANNTTIANLHTCLKILRTLPLLEKYQHDNPPGSNPIKGLLKKQKTTISRVEGSIKK